MDKEKLLLLGLLIKILSAHHQGIGSKSVELCLILIDEKKPLGSSYAEANKNLFISISTIHKVFHTFTRVGIIKRNSFGEFYFDKEEALKIAETGQIGNEKNL